MKRRGFLGILATVTAGGCTGSAGDGRACPELENVENGPFCTSDEPFYLEIEPDRIEIPATVTFTVVNESDRDLVVDRASPYVYEQVGSEWQQDQYVRWRRESDRVTVDDRHSYEKELPFAESWDPEPGEYLVVVPGRLEGPGGPQQSAWLGEFVEIET